MPGANASSASRPVARNRGSSLQSEATHHLINEFIRCRRNVKRFSQIGFSIPEQGIPFFRDSLQLKLLFVEGAATLSTSDAAQILLERKRKEKTLDIGIAIDLVKAATQVCKLHGRIPHVIDYEVAVAKTPMVRDQKCDR